VHTTQTPSDFSPVGLADVCGQNPPIDGSNLITDDGAPKTVTTA
jgi:hypothetical protein